MRDIHGTCLVLAFWQIFRLPIITITIFITQAYLEEINVVTKIKPQLRLEFWGYQSCLSWWSLLSWIEVLSRLFLSYSGCHPFWLPQALGGITADMCLNLPLPRTQGLLLFLSQHTTLYWSPCLGTLGPWEDLCWAERSIQSWRLLLS